MEDRRLKRKQEEDWDTKDVEQEAKEIELKKRKPLEASFEDVEGPGLPAFIVRVVSTTYHLLSSLTVSFSSEAWMLYVQTQMFKMLITGLWITITHENANLTWMRFVNTLSHRHKSTI